MCAAVYERMFFSDASGWVSVVEMNQLVAAIQVLLVMYVCCCRMWLLMCQPKLALKRPQLHPRLIVSLLQPSALYTHPTSAWYLVVFTILAQILLLTAP